MLQQQEQQRHFLLMTFPTQGHNKLALQFAESLIRMGAHVTCVTCVSTHRRMIKSPPPKGLSFAIFSDGYDDEVKPGDDDQHHFIQLKCNGSKTLTDLIVSNANQGRPFTCLVYTMLIPWAADVAREHHLPSVLLWIQPAMVFDIYYYYFNGFADVIRNNPSCSTQLPGLPLLTSRELPSFLLASNPYPSAVPTFEAHLKHLKKRTIQDQEF